MNLFTAGQSASLIQFAIVISICFYLFIYLFIETQNIFDELKVEMKDMVIPAIMYNNLIFVYGFHGMTW